MPCFSCVKKYNRIFLLLGIVVMEKDKITSASGLKKGRVRWFNNQKGFGYIVLEDGSEVFVHKSQIEGGTLLRDGQEVSLDTTGVWHGQGIMQSCETEKHKSQPHISSGMTDEISTLVASFSEDLTPKEAKDIEAGMRSIHKTVSEIRGCLYKINEGYEHTHEDIQRVLQKARDHGYNV